ncbi:MAG: transketolase [Gaiellales bacterium]|nr:transketolase [Gaiellales bacterium]
MRTMRAQAAATVVDLFGEDQRVAVVLAEISRDLYGPAFRHDPSRAFNVGIMEPTMIGVAAGLAMEGFHPVAHTIAPFMAERALEQIKLDLGNQEVGATLIAHGGSFDYAEEGTTHHSPGDVQAMLTIPGVEVLVPGHPDETDRLLRATYANGRVTYVRLALATNPDARHVEPGRIEVIRRGEGPAVLAVGPMLERSLMATAQLDPTVLYATTVAPLDGDALRSETRRADTLFVVEPFYEGTLAGLVTAELVRSIRLRSIGVPRKALRGYGSYEEHERVMGLDADGIRRRVDEALAAAAA